MARFRRLLVPGGTYFFTVALDRRGSSLLVDQVGLLRDCWRDVRAEHPFRVDAAVILPDHLHAIWTLPPGDSDFSGRWKRIKAAFSHRLGPAGFVRPSLAAKGESGIWQRRFWEHHIRDATDLAAHRHYCWINPVRHGFVQQPADWPFSSFHRDVRGETLASGPDIRCGEP